MKKIFLTTILLAASVLAFAQTERSIPREDIEWIDVWGPHNNDNDLPRVLLVGDSITRQYNAGVEQNLDGKAYVERLSTSKSLGDPAFVEEVRTMLEHYDFDVIHFNNGLHGAGYTNEQYASALREIYGIVRSGAPHARLIWATTTPVRVAPQMSELAPATQRSIDRNDIVRKFMADKDVVIDDLFESVGSHPEYYTDVDGVHLNQTGIEAAAKAVADCISEVLDSGRTYTGLPVYWDTDRFYQAPAATPLPRLDNVGIKAALLDGVDFMGDKTQFFVYYGVPEGADADHPAPAMVLIHGGGGTAYWSWVKTWVDRGYAAIAMSNNGQFPVGIEGNPYDKEWGNWALVPGGIHLDCGDFGHAMHPAEEQWAYCAIADIMLAHSFLRSLPGVDTERVGVTGNSWGGFLTLLSAAVDKRYRFAAPVYGCGYYDEFDLHAGQTGKAWERWLELWDPCHYIGNIDIPVSWACGTNDFYFSFGPLQKSMALAKEKYSAVRSPMIHTDGADPAGQPAETFALADHFFKGGPDLPKASAPIMVKNGKATVEYCTAGRKVEKIELIFSKGEDGRWDERRWEIQELPLPKKEGKVTFKVPEGASMFFVNVTTEGDIVASSPCIKVAS